MFLWFMQPDIWLTLITLTFLEIILGVDNIIFSFTGGGKTSVITTKYGA